MPPLKSAISKVAQNHYINYHGSDTRNGFPLRFNDIYTIPKLIRIREGNQLGPEIRTEDYEYEDTNDLVPISDYNAFLAAGYTLASSLKDGRGGSRDS